MTIDNFKELLDGFDPSALLPEMDTVTGAIVPIVRVAVLAGPIVLLVLGLVYLFLAPKEANYYVGYRCYYGMGSEEAWRYTQQLAGIVLGALGFVLTVVMGLLSMGFGQLPVTDVLGRAVSCVLWEAGLVAAACLGINIMVSLRFNEKGIPRKKSASRR